MNAPRPDRLLPSLVRLYALALWLYPGAFRSDYAEEMQDVFRLRLEDAFTRGRSASLRLVFKEVVTLPLGAISAHSQARRIPNIITLFLGVISFLIEKGSNMDIRRHFPKSAEPTPWLVAILSLAPFILPGPLAPLLNYHPWWDPDALPLIEAARVPLTVGLLFLGFIVGILRGFPRWSYLYSLFILFLLPLGAISLIDRLRIVSPDFQGYLLMLLVALLLVLAFIARRYLHFLRPFFDNIRQDWTLLSYALYACALFITAGNDKEESPVYNLQVLLPSLITWLGALAYLRLRDPLKKVGALLGAILLGMSIWWWPVFNGSSGNLLGFLTMSVVLIFWWLILGGLVLAPLLVNAVFRRSSETTP